MAYQNSLFEALEKMSEEEKDDFITHICLIWDNKQYSDEEFKSKFSEAVLMYIPFEK